MFCGWPPIIQSLRHNTQTMVKRRCDTEDDCDGYYDERRDDYDGYDDYDRLDDYCYDEYYG